MSFTLSSSLGHLHGMIFRLEMLKHILDVSVVCHVFRERSELPNNAPEDVCNGIGNNFLFLHVIGTSITLPSGSSKSPVECNQHPFYENVELNSKFT